MPITIANMQAALVKVRLHTLNELLTLKRYDDVKVTASGS